MPLSPTLQRQREISGSLKPACLVCKFQCTQGYPQGDLHDREVILLATPYSPWYLDARDEAREKMRKRLLI